MKYTVKKYNDFYFDIYVGDFNVMRVDAEDSETERQCHARIKPDMEALNGEWLIGEQRIDNIHGYYEKSNYGVTIVPEMENDRFIPERKLVITNGAATISKCE